MLPFGPSRRWPRRLPRRLLRRWPHRLLPLMGVQLFLLLHLCPAQPAAHAQDCIDYSEYLHWHCSMPLGSDAKSIAVRGGIAYLGLDSAVLQTIDVTDPDAPVVLGQVDTPGTRWT